MLPNIYANFPIALAPAQSIATFPVNTFLENLAIVPTGEIFITSHETGEIYKFDRKSELTVYAKLDGKVSGIALVKADSFLVNGWNADGVPFVAILSNDEPAIAAARR